VNKILVMYYIYGLYAEPIIMILQSSVAASPVGGVESSLRVPKVGMVRSPDVAVASLVNGHH